MDMIGLAIPPQPYFITIGQTRYAPGEMHPNRRSLGIFDWLFVTEGVLAIGEDERTWEVGPGQSLLLLPDRYHYAAAPCRTETVFYWIHFDYSGLYRMISQADQPIPIRHAWANPYMLQLPQYASPSQFQRIEPLLAQLLALTAASGAAAYWQEQQLFLDLLRLAEAEEPDNGIPPAMRKLAAQTEAYLRRHYRDDLTNEQLAQALHFHPNYIVRAMKAVYGCTPMDYLLRLRLEQAKLLLIKTDWPVAQIAERVGFRYAPYFSSCFKRYTGMAPLSFRKGHGE